MYLMATFEFRNITDFQRKLRSLSADLRSRAESAIDEEADMIVERAKNEFVPVKSGKLRDSIKKVEGRLAQGRDTRGQFTSGSDIEIAITAGGDDIPHAIAVHETPSPRDPPTWEGKNVNFRVGGSKYLELPLRQAEKGMNSRIGRKLKI
jgi:hypothetical protein